MDGTDQNALMTALAERIDQLVSTNPRLQALLTQLVESKHISSMRRTWLPRHRTLRQAHATDPAAFGQKVLTATQTQRGLATKLEKQLHDQMQASLRAIETLASQRNKILTGLPKLTRTKQTHARQQSHVLASRQLGIAAKFKNDLRQSYVNAFLAGMRASGHPTRPTQEELRWVDSAWKHELRYVNRLVGEISQGTPVDRLQHRIKMYPRVVRAMFDAGRVAGGHPDALIYWEVDHDAEHCPDCLYLESLAPFTAKTLPTTPRAGLCRCLGNCKCRLVTVHATNAVVRKRNRELPTREAIVRKIQSARRA